MFSATVARTPQRGAGASGVRVGHLRRQNAAAGRWWYNKTIQKTEGATTMKYREMIPYLFCFMFINNYSLASMEIKDIKKNKMLVYKDDNGAYATYFDCLSEWSGIHIAIKDKETKLTGDENDVRMIAMVDGHSPIILTGTIKRSDSDTIIISARGRNKVKDVINNMYSSTNNVELSIFIKGVDNAIAININASEYKPVIKEYNMVCD